MTCSWWTPRMCTQQGKKCRTRRGCAHVRRDNAGSYQALENNPKVNSSVQEGLFKCVPAEVRADRLQQAMITDLKKVISNTGYPQFPKNLLQTPTAAKKNEEVRYHSIPAFTSSGGVCGTAPRASCVSGSNGCMFQQKMYSSNPNGRDPPCAFTRCTSASACLLA
jgi:hypothetical protein